MKYQNLPFNILKGPLYIKLILDYTKYGTSFLYKMLGSIKSVSLTNIDVFKQSELVDSEGNATCGNADSILLGVE